MSAADVVVGIDSSMTATKVIAWDAAGHALAETRRAIALSSPRPNHYEQDAEQWWSSTAAGLCELTGKIDATRIAAIAVSNQRETFVPVDASDVPLRPAIVWLDERCEEEVAWLAGRVGMERIHRISGKPVHLTPVIYRIAWLVRNEPALAKATARYADVHAYIVRRLAGRWATSWASADPLGCFDMMSKSWSADILDALSLRSTQFPDLAAPGTPLGEVTAKAASETGLAPGTLVVAGGGDGQCAGLGCNVLSSERACLNLGTAVVCGVHGEDYSTHDTFRTMTSCSADGYVYESVIRSGTFLLNWLVRDVFAADPVADPGVYDTLEQAASVIAIGSEGLLLVPYWSGVMTPYWDLDARGSMVGFRSAHGRAHMYRAVLEGIALEQTLLTRCIEEATGHRAHGYVAIGGGAASDLWCQIIADCANKAVERSATIEASNLGAAMAAAVGAGWFSSFTEAATAMSGKTTKVFLPIALHVEQYARILDVYRDVYPRLSGLYGDLKRALVNEPVQHLH